MTLLTSQPRIPIESEFMTLNDEEHNLDQPIDLAAYSQYQPILNPTPSALPPAISVILPGLSLGPLLSPSVSLLSLSISLISSSFLLTPLCQKLLQLHLPHPSQSSSKSHQPVRQQLFLDKMLDYIPDMQSVPCQYVVEYLQECSAR